jgi:secreted PhoX family phosphatase
VESDPFAPHIGFLPKRSSSTDGILIINHEYINSLFVAGYTGTGPKTPEQIRKEQAVVGMSVVRVKRSKAGRWSVDSGDSTYAPSKKLSKDRTANLTILESGVLHVADFGRGVVGGRRGELAAQPQAGLALRARRGPAARGACLPLADPGRVRGLGG